jgi:cellulose synthase/poly-beta-1,6-N-acetylglucosamine synthase-like glycosyltransferase
MSRIGPQISVVIPMRNEERHIVRCLHSLLEQTYPAEQYELIVVDGNSSDRSLELVCEMSQSEPPIRVLSNPGAIVPIAMNKGIHSARGEIIIRADAHTVYPPSYVENCVKYLEKTGADSVGGPLNTMPASRFFGAQLVAAVLSNRFGVGNSRFRTGKHEGYVDTVPFGAFRRHLFDRIGLFNETLVRNQDIELSARIRRAGGKIYQTPALGTEYFAVDTFAKLVVQTYKNNRWHFFTMRQTGNALGVRHLVPALFLGTVAVLLLLSLISTSARVALGLLSLLYFAAGLYFSLSAPRTVPLTVRIALPIAFLIFHMSYGFGTIVGLRFAVRTPNIRPIRL